MICKATRLSAWALALLWAALACAPLQAASSNSDSSGHLAETAPRVIVRFRTEVSDAHRRGVRTAFGVSQITPLPLIQAEAWSVAGDPHLEAARLSENPEVLYAEPDYIRWADGIPNDARFDEQWGLHNTGQTQGVPDADIDAPEAWELGTGQPIVLGIIDTGIDTLHPDLVANLWRNPGEIPGNDTDDDDNGFVDDVFGWDFVEWDNHPFDQHGHGTHVAGIAAAAGNNGFGVAGVHWSAKVAALRFLNANGQGATSAAVQALQYAVRMHMPITCNSWGGGPYSQALRDAIVSAGDSGMLFVAAAGNSGKNTDITPHYPASYDLDAIVSVAATNHNDRLANELLWRSNFGFRSVDLGAPGVDILSTWPDSDYVRLSGTSMATPHVAGAAALLWSEHPELTATSVKARLLATVDPLSDLRLTTVSGGRLNLKSALAGSETLPPAAVVLYTERVEGTRAHLSFRAPGDDGQEGNAERYIVRYATVPIAKAPPELLTERILDQIPGPPGSPEQVVIPGLSYGATYYLVLRAEDDWFNASPWSNEVMFTTLGPPVFEESASVTAAELAAGSDTALSLTLFNRGAGELFFQTSVEYPHDRSAAAAAQSPDTLDVLLVYADNGALGLRDQLRSFADVRQVVTWNAAAGAGSVPDFRDVRGFDVVVAWNNRAWADPFEIGGLLAECIDSGLAVVTLVDCWGTGFFASLGKYFEDDGYSPFISTGDALFEVRTLGEYTATHPIMKGVGDLAIASYHNQVRLSDGARPVAYWNDGTPLVATTPHSVAINVWPGDGYHWLGDFPRLVHNAIRYAAGLDSWLDVLPASGEVAGGDSLTIELRVDARRLIAGEYTGFVNLATSDPVTPESEHTVRATVVGSARLQVSEATLEWANAFFGFPDTNFVILRNSGTAPLVVHSPAFDVPFFRAAAESVMVSPEGTDSLAIVFDPPSVGEIWCNLDLLTNDPGRPSCRIVLHASTSLPPVVQVTEPATSAELYSGDTALDTLRIVNTGEGALRFRTALRGGIAPLARRVGRAVAGALSDSVPALAWTRYADLSPNHEFETLRKALTRYGTPVSLATTTTSQPEELEELLFDRQLFVVLEQENALPDLLSIGASFAPVLQEFVRRGGTVLFLLEWGTSSGLASSTGLLDVSPVGRGSEIPLRKAVAGHPLLSGVSDALVGSNLTVWYEVRSPGVQTIVTDTSGRYAVAAESRMGAGRCLLLGFDFFTYNDETARMLHNAVLLARQNLGWLGVTPDSGWVNAGDGLALEVRYSAEAVDGGTYAAEIVLETNDPETGRVSVPAELQVTDAPHLRVPASLGFGNVYSVITSQRTVLLKNTGNLTLRIDSLGSPSNGYLWDAWREVELPPRSELSLKIRFTSATTGPHDAALRLYTNDPLAAMHTVALSAFVMIAPRLDFDPDTLTAHVPQGGRTDVQFTVRNEGGSTLQLEVSPGYDGPDAAPNLAWVPLAPLPTPMCQAGVVAAGDGRVYVFGGFGAARNVTRSAFVLNPALGQWVALAQMPTGDFGMATAVDREGRIYSFSAGVSGSYRYDPLGNSWTRIADMPLDRAWGAGATLGADGWIYVTGGEGDGPNDPLALTQVYHPDQDFWTIGAPLTVARYGHTAVTGPDGRIYVIGGRTSFEGSPISSVEVFDPVTSSWSSRADRPEAVNQFAACLGPDQRVYTAGGKSSYEQGLGPFTSSVWIYDPVLDSWAPGPSLPRAVGECGAAISGDYLRIIGGTDSAVVAEHWGLRAPAWLGWESQHFTIEPAESLSVSLNIEAGGLHEGLHLGHARLTSNDPLGSPLEKPITLDVSTASRLWLLDTAAEFGDLHVGLRDSLALKVANVGSAPLEVHAVSSAPSIFPPPEPLSISGGSIASLWLYFAPDAPGPIAGQIELHTSDPEHSVHTLQLSGTGVQAGSLSLDTSGLVLELPPLAETSVTILVRNEGAGLLHWSLSGADAELVNPGGAALRPQRVVEAAGSRGRRLTGVSVAATDFSFSPGYALALGDLEARGAGVTDFLRPFTVSWLDSIDVLILDNYVGSLSSEELATVRDWTIRGGRLLLQNSRVQAIRGANKLLEGTGLALFTQGQARFVYSRFAGRAVAWGSDSIATGFTSLWCHADERAEVLVRDSLDRAVAAAVQLGAGRMVVASWEVLDDRYMIRADTRDFVGEMLDWLAVGTPLVAMPNAGTIHPGGSVEVRLATMSRPLAAGTYEERLTVHSDDPARESVDLGVSLVVKGEAELKLITDTLGFDTTFVGYGEQSYLPVFNAGTAVLTVVPSSAQPMVFQVADSTISVPPLDSVFVPVRFTPPSEGVFAGLLYLFSNDPAAPMASLVLAGAGLRPPVLVSQNTPIEITVQSGDSATATVSLVNQGESDLKLTVLPVPDSVENRPRRTVWSRSLGAAHPSISEPATTAPKDSATKRSVAPTARAADFAHQGEKAGFYIGDDGDVWSFNCPITQSQLYQSMTVVVYRVQEVDHVKRMFLLNSAGFVADSLIVTREDSAWVELELYAHSDDHRAALERRYVFENKRKYLAMETQIRNTGQDVLESVVLKQIADWDLEGTWNKDNWDYDRLRNMPYGWEHQYAAIAGLEFPAAIDFDGRNDFNGRLTTVDYAEGPVLQFDGWPILHFELGDLAPGEAATVRTVLAMGDSLSDLQREVDRGLQRVEWLDANVRSVVVRPGAQFDLNLTFDAAALFAGEYRARLVVGSNDPATPQLTWPVKLRVLGAPAASVDRDTVKFGTVYMGYPTVLDLAIANLGTDSLRFFNVSSDLAEVETFWTQAHLGPRSDTTLRVAFTPRSTGAVTGRLVLYHDDTLLAPFDLPVRAQVEWPPTLDVLADTMGITLGAGTLAYRSYTMHNRGPGTLHWSFSPHGQISAVPPSGQLPPQASALVTFRVSAAGLPAGRLLTAVELVHNDPALGPVFVPFDLDVFAVRRGDTYTDNQLDVKDIVFMVNSIWKGGPDPVGDSGDLDCDHAVTLTDLMLLVNLIFKAGPPPTCD